MKYELVELERLIPLEEVFPSHLENIRQLIYRDGVITLLVGPGYTCSAHIKCPLENKWTLS